MLVGLLSDAHGDVVSLQRAAAWLRSRVEAVVRGRRVLRPLLLERGGSDPSRPRRHVRARAPRAVAPSDLPALARAARRVFEPICWSTSPRARRRVGWTWAACGWSCTPAPGHRTTSTSSRGIGRCGAHASSMSTCSCSGTRTSRSPHGSVRRSPQNRDRSGRPAATTAAGSPCSIRRAQAVVHHRLDRDGSISARVPP